MLKKIGVEQLRSGMFLQEFCDSWMEHPFWRNSFVLRSEKDIAAIRASSIKEVWIDSSKGLDVPESAQSISVAEAEAQADAELKAAAGEHNAHAKASLASELSRATKICAEAKDAVSTMFQEARLGKAVNTDSAQQLVAEIFSLGQAQFRSADQPGPAEKRRRLYLPAFGRRLWR